MNADRRPGKGKVLNFPAGPAQTTAHRLAKP
jgi:hypothetical protein